MLLATTLESYETARPIIRLKHALGRSGTLKKATYYLGMMVLIYEWDRMIFLAC